MDYMEAILPTVTWKLKDSTRFLYQLFTETWIFLSLKRIKQDMSMHISLLHVRLFSVGVIEL